MQPCAQPLDGENMAGWQPFAGEALFPALFVAGWKSRSIIKQGKLGKAEIADGTLVYAAGDKTGDDSFVVQYTMADGTVIDVTYSVTVKAAETGKNDGDGKGDGVAKTGAAVGALDRTTGKP